MSLATEMGELSFRDGRYKLENLVGESSKSKVFRAVDTEIEREVAVKILKPGQGPERLEQFVEEGKNLGKLTHDRIVRIYDAGEEEGLRYIVMEYISGTNLQDQIELGKKHSVSEVVDIMIDIGSAVRYSDSRDVSHSDIKLKNISVRDKGGRRKAFLLDYGGRLTQSDSEKGLESDPPFDDVAAIGRVGKRLLINGLAGRKFPRGLRKIIEKAEQGRFESPEGFLETLTRYRNKRMLVNSLLVSSGLIGGIIAGMGGIFGWSFYSDHLRYNSSANVVLDELDNTTPIDIGAVEGFSGDLVRRAVDNKVDWLYSQRNIKMIEDGVEVIRFPYDISPGGREWSTTDGRHWSDGYGLGILWMRAGEGNGNCERLARIGINHIKPSDLDNITMNSLRYFYSFAKGFEVTGDINMRDTALLAAEKIAERYNDNGNYLQLARKLNGPGEQEIFIDSLDAVPFLSWAVDNNPRLKERYIDIIKNHCNNVIRYNLNFDGSTVQDVKFDSQSGERLGGIRAYGYDGESCHSRGQARAIRGFVSAYEATGEEKFLDAARKCADYFIDNLPEDYVPYYDFKDPNIGKPKEPGVILPKDSSAASIGASGLIDLFEATGDSQYYSTACKILGSLSRDYLSRDLDYQGLLLRGCSDKNLGGRENCSLIYGDYYFIEALMRIK